LGVNVATSATVEEYSLLRDQLWFGLQKWLKDGGAILSDPKLEAEFVAPTYAFDLRGRIRVEPKEKSKERLIAGPRGCPCACRPPTATGRGVAHLVDLRG